MLRNLYLLSSIFWVSSFMLIAENKQTITPKTQEPEVKEKVGIGIEVENLDQDYMIKKIFKGGPVHQEGSIKVGDYIIAVKVSKGSPWVETKGISLEELAGYVSGAPRTEVQLRMVRVNLETKKSTQFEVTIKRKKFSIHPD